MEYEELQDETVMRIAAELCLEDSKIELRERGPLPPCRKLSPLTPPLRMEEYQMMERDRGKCTLIIIYTI